MVQEFPNVKAAAMQKSFLSIAKELFYVTLFFWVRSGGTPGKNVLLSAIGTVAIFAARYSQSDYSTHSSASASLIVYGVAFLTAIVACRIDLKTKTDDFNTYWSNVTNCYQVIACGVLISTLVISSNIIVRWSERIGGRFGLHELSEIAGAVAAPAALIAFVVLGIFSFVDREICKAAFADKWRAILWPLVILAAIFIANCSIFAFK